MSISFSTDNLHPPLFRRICQRSDGVQNNFIPGGSGRPPATLFIFSCSRVSALRRASAWAATMRSSTISFSDGLMSESSIVTPFHLALAGELDGDEPAARGALDLDLVELGLHRLHLGLEFGACFIRPRKSAIAHLLPRVCATTAKPQARRSGGRSASSEVQPRGQDLRRRSPPAPSRTSTISAPGKRASTACTSGSASHAGLELGLPRVVLRS